MTAQITGTNLDEREASRPGWIQRLGRLVVFLGCGLMVFVTLAFLALQLLPFSLVCCRLMQRRDSIWGSILFHAALNIPIAVEIFSSLRGTKI